MWRIQNKQWRDVFDSNGIWVSLGKVRYQNSVNQLMKMCKEDEKKKKNITNSKPNSRPKYSHCSILEFIYIFLKLVSNQTEECRSLVGVWYQCYMRFFDCQVFPFVFTFTILNWMCVTFHLPYKNSVIFFLIIQIYM